MVTHFAGWVFNLMLWGAIILTVALTYNAFVGPILNELNALIGLGLIAVFSLFWPRF